MAQQISVKIKIIIVFLLLISARLLPVWRLNLLYHADPPPGDDEKVDRSLGGNIFEGNTLVILVEELCRDRTIQNLVKYRSRGFGDISAA